jgi:hypothetical protein
MHIFVPNVGAGHHIRLERSASVPIMYLNYSHGEPLTRECQLNFVRCCDTVLGCQELLFFMSKQYTVKPALNGI